jgi:hypothetical protein
MGYSTEFLGELKFNTKLTIGQIADLSNFLGEDCREHPEWGRTDMTYIDLKFLSDFSGIKWDGSEKTYDLTEKVNLIIEEMQKLYPEFGLSGQIVAQGEDLTDRWVLAIQDGKAVERKIQIKGKQVTCPHCEEEFLLEE